MSDVLSLILKKREGCELTETEIFSWIKQIGKVPDYQSSALLAFIFQKGMSASETAHLTEAMRYSGKQFSYKGFSKDSLFIDKHSTGGVGDKITLPLSALITACDESFYFPTISGRGLGHTGGTIDKLESIPGFKPETSLNKFYKQLKKHRICFLQQGNQIVPADRVLYALRDVTGTVESIALITASILSKKLSETLDFLLIDLKFGNGAFLSDLEQTDKLAESLLEVCRASSLKASVMQTRMDTPLGLYSGNRLEALETLSILRGDRPHSATDLTVLFAVKFLSLKGYSEQMALELIQKKISSGEAYVQFEKVIAAQGGSLTKLEKTAKAAKTKIKVMRASRAGYLSFNVRKLGLAIVALGGGRKTKLDKIDPDVGLYHPLESGDRVEKGQELLRIYYRDSARLTQAMKLINDGGVEIKEMPSPKSPLVRRVLST